ncbi:hypothetical protein SAMN05421783_11964 [Thiocapsa roseopersicina]|uniref:Uncharacterized protein n=1 Tax=Thiocapsa roseopersicina TaxID=1058 RepID=A0A1H3AEP5_THIRO|nr:hypothetical protein SAMN05421783_11964 [Thiocapsa roseopersicina]
MLGLLRYLTNLAFWALIAYIGLLLAIALIL